MCCHIGSFVDLCVYVFLNLNNHMTPCPLYHGKIFLAILGLGCMVC